MSGQHWDSVSMTFMEITDRDMEQYDSQIECANRVRLWVRSRKDLAEAIKYAKRPDEYQYVPHDGGTDHSQTLILREDRLVMVPVRCLIVRDGDIVGYVVHELQRDVPVPTWIGGGTRIYQPGDRG